MKIQPEIIERLGELFGLATATAFIGILVITEWRKKPLQALAGLVGGTVIGIVCWRFGLHPGWQALAASAGALMKPAIVLWTQGKTPSDLAREILDIRDRALKGGKSKGD